MPETKDSVIKNVTTQYFQSVSKANPPSPDQVQKDLVNQVKAAFRSINASLPRDQQKWAPPEALEPVQIATAMYELYHIGTIKACGESSDERNCLLCMYCDSGENNGLYVDSDRVLFNLAKQFKYTLNKREYNEVIFNLKTLAPEKSKTMDPDLIAVNNGIFDYRAKTLYPFSPDYIFTCKSHVDYVDNPPNPVIHNPDDGTDWDVESWIAEIMDNDPELIQLVWEILGAIVRPHVRWNKSAWLYSTTGNNGKGTLCELMRNLVGRSSCTSIPIRDFSKDFMLEPLTHMQAIITDENDVGTFIDNAANLKAIITNDVIYMNRKFKEPIAYQFFGFMVQCLNELPRAKDKSDSFYRRQLFVPFTKCFTGRERKYIKDDYLRRPEVLEYVLWKVLNMDYYTLSEPAACKLTLAEYKEYNDPIRQFAEEMLPQCRWHFLPFTFVYDLYKAWFKKNNPSGIVLNNKSFINDLLTILASDPSPMWVCPDKTQQVRVGTMMADPEPLILQYNLDDWRNPAYRGTDPDMICCPVQNGTYRGLRRVITQTPPQNPSSGVGSTDKAEN